MKATPYFFFDGNCMDAIKFYQAAFGGELKTVMMKDIPNCPPGSENRVMHAYLKNGDLAFYASDSHPDLHPNIGQNICINVDADSEKHLDELFAKLSVGGKVDFKPQKMFWNAYWAHFTDKYGNDWMLNFDLNPKTS